jgi:4-amino-4-deoxy-L-arabinose transferase-like glycosyltransferase
MRTPSRGWIAVAVVLAAIGLGFLIYAAPQLGAPFGESHDGLNGAVWANGSRQLRDVGPIDSAFGGRRPDGDSYAHHPPAIYSATALAEGIGGEGPWSTRAPAWLATLLSIPLLWVILRRLRIAPIPALVGTAVATTTPMLFVYGGMLDTPIVAFPLGLAVFLVWIRSWDGDSINPKLVGLLALIACLTAWQAMFAVGLAALSLGWRARQDRGGWAVPVAFGVGGALGALVTVVWSIWASGSTSTLVDQFLGRSGSEGGATWIGMASHQWTWLLQLLGVAFIGLVLCVLAPFWEHGVRRAAAVGSLVVVFGYSVLLHSGAYVHQYWNYWVILPVAIGAGLGADAAMRAARVRGSSAIAATVTVVVLGLIVVASARLLPSPDRTMMSDGDVPARLLQSIPRPADQDAIHYIGGIYAPEPWLTYLTGLPASPMPDRNELAIQAADRPDALVLSSNSCLSDDVLCITAARLPPAAALGQAEDSNGTVYRIYSLGDLARSLETYS